jgi:hypothetical protein
VKRPEYDFQACLRRPGLRAKERQVLAMLGSTRFPKP